MISALLAVPDGLHQIVTRVAITVKFWQRSNCCHVLEQITLLVPAPHVTGLQ
jgi:hypothetical protein